MAQNTTHSDEELLRYAENSLTPAEKRTVDEHLKVCEDCRQQLSFIEDLKGSLGGLSEEEFSSNEPCPDSETLVSYEAGEVDAETARHLRAHLLFCDTCAKEFYALRRASREESWRELIERLKKFVVDFAQSYGPGALLGQIRVVAEQLAPAVRGGELQKALSKVLEIPVGENIYSLEATATQEGSLSCDVTGLQTMLKVPLSILVRSETGEELLSVESDKLGNCYFSVPLSSGSWNSCVLSFNLQGNESHLLLRLHGAQ
jgi:hypothetical protein